MGLAAFCACFIFPGLTLSVQSPERKGDRQIEFFSKAFGDTGPDFVTGGFLQPFDPNLLVPFPTWDFMDVETGLALKVMNSSWTGPAKTNVYHQGESVFLQITALPLPGQELYVHSCYAGPSPDPAAKSRLALILNKGCVSSKQSMIKFISRKSGEINLLINTSSLKFPQVYIQCSVTLTRHGLTTESKSCNFNESQSRWVELSGETSVCDCCATKCRSSPYYAGLINEFKAVVSTGPLVIKEQQPEELQSFDQMAIADSQTDTSAVSTGSDWILSGASPTSAGKELIVAGASVSGSRKNMYSNSPWPQSSESVMVISQDLGGALSLWLPGLVVDVQTKPEINMGVGLPSRKGVAKIVGVPSQSNIPTQNQLPADMWNETPLTLPDVKSLNHGLMSNGFVADAPYVTGAEFTGDIFGLKDLQKSDVEELRGDVFVNFKEPQVVSLNERSSSLHKGDSDFLASASPYMPQKDEEMAVLTQTEMLFKRIKGDLSKQPDSLKRSKLTIMQGSDGSSSLSYEEEQRTPSLGQNDRMTRIDMERNKARDEGMVKEKVKVDVEKELVQSLLDLLRCQTPVLEGQSLAEFSIVTNLTHLTTRDGIGCSNNVG